jgi:hypothetical protein
MPSGIYIRTEKNKNNISLGKKGKKMPLRTKEHRRKISLNLKERWINPKTRKIMILGKIKGGKTFKKNYKRENHPFFNKKRSEESREKMSLSHREDRTWCWKGGISQNYYRRLIIFIGLKKECQRCGSLKHIVIHHKNRNRKDNRLSNLEILCRRCHFIEHDINTGIIEIKNGN